MGVTVYRSSDASAPSLTGVAGALLDVLDACLVNGYGLKSAAGWTKPFANSGNKGCYRNSTSPGSGTYLAIDDSAAGLGGAKEAVATGYTAMSAVATGTGQFPTTALLAYGGVVIRKSATADATARAWTLIADDQTFYFFTETGDWASPLMAMSFTFGDINSYLASDAYRAIIIGRNLQNSNVAAQEPFPIFSPLSPNIPALTHGLPGHFMAGHWNGAGNAIQVGKHPDAFKLGLYLSAGTSNTLAGTTAMSASTVATNGAVLGANYGTAGNQAMKYPNGPDGAAYLSPVWIHHNGDVRGHLRGLWCACQHLPFNHNDVVAGAGPMAGKTFLAQQILSFPYNTATLPALAVVETSNTW